MTAALLAMLIGAFAVTTVAVEAVRTGRWELGRGSVAEDIPDGFYGDSFLSGAVLDNAGWVVAAGIVWIVAAALLIGLDAARARITGTRGAAIDRTRR
ncbi:hypothetical protein [Brachybacterium hainanense]|uniref:Uncharacterized protein n=1 Tax=Brachybacterium hainanense TaxID=1541174 RepID=A0ABV6RA15_9MICO